MFNGGFMQNIKIIILSLLVISTILIIGIKGSTAMYNKNDTVKKELTISFNDNDSLDITNFNKDSNYEINFSLINSSDDIKKYSIVWVDVTNNVNPNDVLYTVSKCNKDYNNCKELDETILPATTNKTIAAIPSLNNLYIDTNSINYYKLTIKTINDNSNSFKGSIKLLKED